MLNLDILPSDRRANPAITIITHYAFPTSSLLLIDQRNTCKPQSRSAHQSHPRARKVVVNPYSNSSTPSLSHPIPPSPPLVFHNLLSISTSRILLEYPSPPPQHPKKKKKKENPNSISSWSPMENPTTDLGHYTHIIDKNTHTAPSGRPSRIPKPTNAIALQPITYIHIYLGACNRNSELP